ncbi:MAG TPA: AAA family ATPase, partial [Longimicrobiales bacterium]|nr:AAA family ATPase [Longimicrobiales bacterium]
MGSTQLSTQLDPEDLSALLETYRRCCAETIGRWDGYVAKYMGDGMLAYFGWPRAHEDDAERAVRAGLDLVGAVGRLDPAGGTRLAARVGMATGEVVVGDLIGERAAQEHNVVGETPNLAARMQAVAQPGTVVIESRTRRLLGNLFDLRSLGPVALKGFADPVHAYEVLRKSATESRFEALHAQQMPLVGREEEIDLLLRRWEQAKQGEGQVVMLSGEAGIGKSRVCAALLERLADVPHVRLRYFCSPYHMTSPLYPFIAHLERAADFASDDPPATRFDKVAATLVPTTVAPAEDAALLAELLSIPSGEHYKPLALVPEQKKERTLAALLGQLEGLAATKPVLMLFEDLHWVDPTSRELLERTVDRVERLPVLLVLTFRPEFQPPWLGQAHVTMHTLRKFDRRESAALIDRLTGGKALPPEVAQQIIAHTDGVPLFLEELTKAVLEGSLLVEEADRYVLSGPLPPLAIPTTLQASLMARLDRLSSFKDVAQVGAAIGRDFSYELLAAVTGRSEEELQSTLARLVEAELLFWRGAPPRGSLVFKHALVQDAAYASMLRSRRQELHARIARVLEEVFPDTVDAQPELLAHHCARAGLVECAIDYWQRAGERALARSANQEAMQQFGSGIELIKGLPVTPARRRQEFRLHLGLGPAVRAVKGHAAPETLHAFSLARDLIDDDTSMPEQMRVLYGLWGVQYARGEHEAGRSVAEQAVSLVAGTAAAEPQALANRLLGETLWAMGEFVKARHHLERAIDFCGADQPVTDLRFSLDHKAGALSFLGWTLWALGYPERAHA